MYCRDQRNQAFKDCGGVVRLVVIAVIHLVNSRYVVSLWAKIGIFGTRKTYENLSSFFHCVLHEKPQKTSMLNQISLPDVHSADMSGVPLKTL